MARRPARWWFVVGGLLAVSACAACTTDAPHEFVLTSADAASTASKASSTTSTSSTTPRQRRTAEHAIRDWLADHRAEAFPGTNAPYRGLCPESSRTYGFLCSSPVEQVGELTIHVVGVYGTDWGADLLLRGDADTAGWVVIDAQGWPEPELSFGPPWSPLTAVAKWWSEHAEPRYGYGEDAGHLRSCDDAYDDVHNAQLCSTLERDGESRRVYSSGLAGQEPDVYLLVERDPSTYVWQVTDTAPAHHDDDGTTSAPPLVAAPSAIKG